MKRKLRLPQKSDHPIVDDNLTHLYHLPIVGSFFKKRLTMTLDFLNGRSFNRILEVGFGSGVMLHELSKVAKHVYACDIHPHIHLVKNMTQKENLNIHYCGGSIVDLPFKDNSIDCIISVACIEHIHELQKSIFEMKRVLAHGGTLALGFPVETKITDFLLTAAGTTKAYRKKLREVHPNSHSDILTQVEKQFGPIIKKRLPSYLPESISLYYSCVATKPF
ncbi:MAG: class I SAM-dependent methyltransferase [Deltaproteobacteria bacterium]|nr:class I SAM-dependent methyltransferase [Deltaproteobacteria bacterium]